MSKNVVIVIPAYEPSEKMLSFLKELQKETYQVIVVDDGSGEDYQSIFEKAKKYAIVLSESPNQGKGAALKKGYHYIQSHFSSSTIVTMDCDGQHTIKDAKKLIQYAQEHPKELVLGKRLRGKNTPLRSKIGNAITRFIYFLVTGVHLYDTQTGLRAFSSRFLPFMCRIPGNRFEYEMNVILYSALSKIQMTEIEIETIYINHNQGSHFHTIQDSFRIYKEIFLFEIPIFLSLFLYYCLFVLIYSFKNDWVFSNSVAFLFALIIYQILNQKRKEVLFQPKTSFVKSFCLVFLSFLFLSVLFPFFLKFNFSIFLILPLGFILLLIFRFLFQILKNFTKKSP